MRTGDERGGHASDENAAALVILPTYDERSTLEQVVRGVLAASPDVDVLVVDDASPDGTGELADRLAAGSARVRVIHRPAKLGLGTAYLAGFHEALDRGYRVAVEMDSDGSHLPEELPGLLSALLPAGDGPPSGEDGAEAGRRRGTGLAIGSRWIPGGRIVGWPLHRRLISRAGTAVARLALRSRLHDITSGFRAYDTAWLRRLDLDRVTSQGYGFQVELAWSLERLGCPISEVPISFVERENGRSKMTLAIVVEALVNVLRWGFDLRFRPGRLSR